jgi:hypothetical protein
MENYYLYTLSELTQRTSLENFFREIIRLYQINPKTSNIIHIAIHDPKLVGNNAVITFISEMKKPFPRMKVAENVLKVSPIHATVWKYFNFDANCPLPNLDPNLLYGTLSDVVHTPKCKEIIISDHAIPQIRCFFNLLAKHQCTSVREYKEVIALAAAFRKL